MEDGREHKAENFFNFFLNLDKVHLQENSLTFDNNSATPLRRS